MRNKIGKLSVDFYSFLLAAIKMQQQTKYDQSSKEKMNV